MGAVTFALERQSKDPQSVVYTGLYDTEGVAHTKSGERQPLQISIQVNITSRKSNLLEAEGHHLRGLNSLELHRRELGVHPGWVAGQLQDKQSN